MVKRFNITYRDGAYYVSEPNIQGMTVVDATSFDVLVKALEDIAGTCEPNFLRHGTTAEELRSIARGALASLKGPANG